MTAGYILTCKHGNQVSSSCKISLSHTYFSCKRNRSQVCGNTSVFVVSHWICELQCRIPGCVGLHGNETAELKIIPWIFQPWKDQKDQKYCNLLNSLINRFKIQCPAEFSCKETVTVTIRKKSFKQKAKIVKHLSFTAQHEAEVPDLALSSCCVLSDYRQRTTVQEQSWSALA